MTGKGRRCTKCGRYTMDNATGVWQCRKCRAMSWTPFESPRAGRPRKGFACTNCTNKTVHPLGEVGEAVVYRCSICGTTYVDPKGIPE